MLTGFARLQQRGFFRGWGRPPPPWRRRSPPSAGAAARHMLGWWTCASTSSCSARSPDPQTWGSTRSPPSSRTHADPSDRPQLRALPALRAARRPRGDRRGPAAAAQVVRADLDLDALRGGRHLHRSADPVRPGIPGGGEAAEIIIIGLSVEGAAAVASAFLLGRGRPGLNSVGMGVGATITVTLDVILIPRYGALGGAITSAITYLTTTMVLVILARRQFRAIAQPTAMSRSARTPGSVVWSTSWWPGSPWPSSARSCFFSPPRCGSPAGGPRSTGRCAWAGPVSISRS